jgi:hypothetical protein
MKDIAWCFGVKMHGINIKNSAGMSALLKSQNVQYQTSNRPVTI